MGSCVAGVRSRRLRPGQPDPQGWLAYPADYPPALAKKLAWKDTDPLRITAAKSLFDNFGQDGSLASNSTRNYGGMPLIVLTSTKD